MMSHSGPSFVSSDVITVMCFFLGLGVVEHYRTMLLAPLFPKNSVFYSEGEAVLKALKHIKLTALKCLKITAHRRTARRSLLSVARLDEENSSNSVTFKLQNCNLMEEGSQMIKEFHPGIFKIYRGRHSFLLCVSAKRC